jgi:hypothetical protein
VTILDAEDGKLSSVKWPFRQTGRPHQEPLSKGKIEAALGPLISQVNLRKARAGFTRFEIVEDQRGFL